jgi:chromosome segregation ATPase
MSTSVGQTKLQEARAAIQAAEIIISQEQRAQLEDQLRKAIELAGQIEQKIKDKRSYLETFGTEFPDKWNQRAAVSAEISSLTEQEFYLPEEIEVAETRLRALDVEYSKLTKRITELTYLRAPVEHEIQNLEFDQGRVMKGIGDLRLALNGQLMGPTNGGAVRTSGM